MRLLRKRCQQECSIRFLVGPKWKSLHPTRSLEMDADGNCPPPIGGRDGPQRQRARSHRLPSTNRFSHFSTLSHPFVPVPLHLRSKGPFPEDAFKPVPAPAPLDFSVGQLFSFPSAPGLERSGPASASLAEAADVFRPFSSTLSPRAPSDSLPPPLFRPPLFPSAASHVSSLSSADNDGDGDGDGETVHQVVVKSKAVAPLHTFCETEATATATANSPSAEPPWAVDGVSSLLFHCLAWLGAQRPDRRLGLVSPGRAVGPTPGSANQAAKGQTGLDVAQLARLTAANMDLLVVLTGAETARRRRRRRRRRVGDADADGDGDVNAETDYGGDGEEGGDSDRDEASWRRSEPGIEGSMQKGHGNWYEAILLPLRRLLAEDPSLGATGE
ncbi:unnamed protein product [Protopolystoma xenopodis]|uniref:Uncharacterized protein n=1 Tax=Protopolystoma xenopodis TaxID=117903 RepID=A0A3S5A0E5_9PLAT|nr:unnamed protein product [Protopolystoma xenopodis]